jgi:hypothetical protein
VTAESLAAVEALVMENCQVSVDEIAKILNMKYGSAHHVIHDVLQFHKMSARWMPQQLTLELKQQHVDTCGELLHCLEAEGDAFLSRVVTGDETWVHYHKPYTKSTSKEWRHSSSPKPKRFWAQPSAGKIMMSCGMNEAYSCSTTCLRGTL